MRPLCVKKYVLDYFDVGLLLDSHNCTVVLKHASTSHQIDSTVTFTSIITCTACGACSAYRIHYGCFERMERRANLTYVQH